MSEQVKERFRLFRRGWGTYYVEDTETGKQQTLQTSDKREAQRMVHARNEAQHTPHVNLMIAKAYLAASDPALTSRTWQDALNAIINTKAGDTRYRWESDPDNSRIVGKKSSITTVSRQTVPGFVTPGHFTIIGSRMPPS